MDAIVYTRDDSEYALIKASLEKDTGPMTVDRAALSGHKRYDREYDVAVVALDGAEGMEVMLEHAKRFPDTQIIWVTNDPYFAGMAMRTHIYDFIERPYDEERIERSIREAIALCPNRNQWHLGRQGADGVSMC